VTSTPGFWRAMANGYVWFWNATFIICWINA
jgi:hypothetical protein